LCEVLAATFGAVLAAVKDRGQDFFEAVGLEKAVFDVAGDEVVQFFHGDRAALTAGFALPGFD
jgi:hypothetical protein